MLANQGPTYAKVRFTVLGGGVELFRSSLRTRHSDSVQIDVDVRDVHFLDLVVDGTDDGISGDHAEWASAHLTC